MYFLGWIVLIMLGLGAALWSFLWALESGQMAEQERARFLPLIADGEKKGHTAPRGKASIAPYFLLLVGILLLGAIVACFVLTFGTRGI
jgi:nitrogen fixation-related uncharacterized protein